MQRALRGRPKKNDSVLCERARQLYLNASNSVEFVTAELGISRSTFFRYRDEWNLSTLRVGIQDEYRLSGQVYLRNIDKLSESLLGYDLGLLQEMIPLMGQRIRIIPLKFKDLLPSLVEDRVDILFACLGKSASREKIVQFTDSCRPNAGPDFHLVFARSFDPSSLPTAKVAVCEGSIPHEYVATYFPASVRVAQCNTWAACFNLLLQHQVDCAFLPGIFAKRFLAENSAFTFSRYRDPYAVKTCLVTQKDNFFLLEKCNAALKQLARIELLDRLDEQYS